MNLGVPTSVPGCVRSRPVSVVSTVCRLCAGQPEVDHLEPIRGQDQIRRFEVSMEETVTVQRLQRCQQREPMLHQLAG